MKKLDKVVYFTITIIGIIAIFVISFFIIFIVMNLMNTSEYSKILINANIYNTFYSFLNCITKMAIPIFLIILFIAIPYLIFCIIISIFFVQKYRKFHGEKKKQILKVITLGILTICFVIKGVSLLTFTNVYERKLNSRISEISNIEIRDFLQKEISGDKYVYKIKFIQGFPDDYNVRIYYKDTTMKVKETFLSDYNYDFINANSKNITNELYIKSIVITSIGNILCIYFFIYLLKEFKRISVIL